MTRKVPSEMAEDTATRNTATISSAVDPAVLAHRRSPAQHLADEMARGSGEDVRLRELQFLTQTTLRTVPGGPGSAALEKALGLPLPVKIGEVTGAADGRGEAVLWLGPDEFLAIGPDEAETGVPAAQVAIRLGSALGDQRGQAVDVSANRTTLELSGPRARSVLEKSCELDLHPREFPVGKAVVTLLESTGVVIWRTGEDTWRVMPRASFATHVVRWLLDGMREYV